MQRGIQLHAMSIAHPRALQRRPRLHLNTVLRGHIRCRSLSSQDVDQEPAINCTHWIFIYTFGFPENCQMLMDSMLGQETIRKKRKGREFRCNNFGVLSFLFRKRKASNDTPTDVSPQQNCDVMVAQRVTWPCSRNHGQQLFVL